MPGVSANAILGFAVCCVSLAPNCESYPRLRQKVAFNSPVWFNVGVEEYPQCSACFINSVDDSMESILGLARTEGMLFKYGSGTGSNLSPIRSSREMLKGGGTASCPVSFMKGFDAFAGVIKSGGKTRRAAKMVILNAEHPDILEFIKCKVSDQVMMYGDFYYEDTDDGLIVSATYYHELKKRKEEEEFDYTKLNNATSEKEYSELLKQAERELLEKTIFDRKIYGKNT